MEFKETGRIRMFRDIVSVMGVYLTPCPPLYEVERGNG
jgi:hypothetical protein